MTKRFLLTGESWFYLSTKPGLQRGLIQSLESYVPRVDDCNILCWFQGKN